MKTACPHGHKQIWGGNPSIEIPSFRVYQFDKINHHTVKIKYVLSSLIVACYSVADSNQKQWEYIDMFWNGFIGPFWLTICKYVSSTHTVPFISKWAMAHHERVILLQRYSFMFIVGIFTTTRKQNQPKYTPTDAFKLPYLRI